MQESSGARVSLLAEIPSILSNWATTRAPLVRINMHDDRNTKRAIWFPPVLLWTHWHFQIEPWLRDMFRFSSGNYSLFRSNFIPILRHLCFRLDALPETALSAADKHGDWTYGISADHYLRTYYQRLTARWSANRAFFPKFEAASRGLRQPIIQVCKPIWTQNR